MIPDLDIYRTADALVKQNGDDAVSEARRRVESVSAMGNQRLLTRPRQSLANVEE